MVVYCYSKCSTCKGALKYLDNNHIKYELKDIVNDHPDFNEMKEIIKRSGLAINKFFNTSGILYRELNLKDKLVNLSDDEKIEILVSNGMLIKRPLLVSDSLILRGFNEKNWKELLN